MNRIPPEPDEQVICVCGTPWRGRDLETTITTIMRCRTCKTSLWSQECPPGSIKSDEISMHTNVGEIDTWLSGASDFLVTKVRDKETEGQYQWSLVGNGATCEILYKREIADTALIRTRVVVPTEDDIPDVTAAVATCDEHGLQFTGNSGTFNWWGVKQLVSLDRFMSPLLLKKVIERLVKVTQEVEAKSKP